MKYLFYLIIVIFSGNLIASDTISPNTEEQYFNLTIESVKYDDYIKLDTIDVILETKLPLGGFDLKFGTISNYYRIVDVLKGDFSEKCNWEYFNKKEMDDQYSTWHVVSLANMLPDSTKKVCYYIDSSVVLLRLVVGFSPIDYITPLMDFQQIRFKWDQCRDNTISSVSGDTLMVFNKLHEDLTIPFRPPEECYQNQLDRVQNIIIFKNGDFKVDFNPYKKSDEVYKNLPEILLDSLNQK